MSRQNIKKFSIGFHLVLTLGAFYHRLYYRRFKTIHRDKIPKKSPVIFAINHQNALMDALALIFSARNQIVFMARADIFKKKIIASLLYFIKILPVYRIRDGFHSVDKNKGVFKEAIDVLKHNRPVGILPEGNHCGEKRLRPLKKGAGRLALLAEEANDFKLGLSIVPVGLDYSNYYNAGSDLLVIFGNPIRMDAYREMYSQNPVVCINQLKDDLALAMNEVMIDISSEEHYKSIQASIELYGPVELKKQKLRNNLLNNFKIKKQLSEILLEKISGNEEDFKDLKSKVGSYEQKMKKYGLKDRVVSKEKINPVSLFLKSLVAILLLPLHIYGMIINYLPYALPIYLTRKIKDRHFISSIRFGTGLIFFFTWYVLLIIISLFIFDGILTNLIFIISMPLTGLFAFYYYIHLLRLRGEMRWMILKKKAIKDELINARNDIIIKIEELTSK